MLPNKPLAGNGVYIRDELHLVKEFPGVSVTDLIATGDYRNHAVSSSVLSFDGTRIHYDLYDAPSRSLILVVPGFWRDRGYPSMSNLARFLNRHGYRVAIVDVRGHGDSEGTYGFNLNEHYDVAAVARELFDRLPIETMTLLGFSVGGSIAISTAARHHFPLSSVMLISAVGDFSKIVPRINPFTIHRHIAFEQALRTPRFDWRFTRSDKLQGVDDIAEVHAPVCLIHVKNDWLIDHHQSEWLYQRANEPKELHVIDVPGNYHADRVFSQLKAEIEPIVSNFLLKYTPR
jgi:pimeloyl-ACP methyl ester carboxylesterase